MFYRRDDWVFNNFIQAIPNCNVTYLTQPGLAPATIYADPNGATEITNPQLTDGFGHAVAYMAAGIYTVIYSGEQIITQTLPDQVVGPAGGGGGSITPFEGVPQGVVDGVNAVFVLTNAGTPLVAAPSQVTVWLNFPLVPNVGYTLSGVNIIYTNAPKPGDSIYARGYE